MYTISNFNKSSKNLYIFQKIISILVCIIIIPIIVFNFVLIIKNYIYPYKTPDFMGLKSFVIVSESMEPTIMTGDVIIVKNINYNELKVNDIISYNYDGINNTHRIT